MNKTTSRPSRGHGPPLRYASFQPKPREVAAIARGRHFVPSSPSLRSLNIYPYFPTRREGVKRPSVGESVSEISFNFFSFSRFSTH